MALSNYIPSSRVMQPGVCTSSTRPASPYEGMVIYETDTNKTYVYNGSAWVMMVAADSPPGIEFIKSNTATSGTTCDVTSCFNSNYDAYRIVLTSATTNTTGDLTLTLLSGTTAAASNWTWGNLRFDYAAGNTNYSKGTSTASANISIGHTNPGGTTIDLYSPYLSQYTTFTGMGTDTRGSTGYIVISSSGILANSTSYDGLRIQTTQTFTNIKVAVYGYRNSI